MLQNDTAIRQFADIFHENPTILARAPGRINIIGEHTDYNDGFVLPMAISRCVMVACGPSEGNTIRCYSEQYGHAEFDKTTVDRYARTGWKAYVAGVIAGIRDQGIQIPPLNLAITSDVPAGKGLSSSAALEVAVAISILEFLDIRLDTMAIADLCRDAENRYAGMPCGIMDQYAVLFGRYGYAIFIDCMTREYQPIPIDDSSAFVLFDSGDERALVSSGYSDRYRECREALTWFREREPAMTSYRDMNISWLFEHRHDVPELFFKRALHVVGENRRVLDTVSACRRRDERAIGRLLFKSHWSLSRNYDVSNQALNNLVKKAKASRYICGARLHGGGFGGYTINLIAADEVSQAQKDMRQHGIVVKSGKGAESWRI